MFTITYGTFFFEAPCILAYSRLLPNHWNSCKTESVSVLIVSSCSQISTKLHRVQLAHSVAFFVEGRGSVDQRDALLVDWDREVFGSGYKSSRD